MDLEFTVTETVTRDNGRIMEVNYEFDEVFMEKMSLGIARKRESRIRTYTASITRNQYNQLAQQKHNALSFDDFIFVFRPFMMGFYEKLELEKAFSILDKDGSGEIDVNELSVFVPFVDEYATSQTLKNCMKKLGVDIIGTLNYNDFQSAILKGIGRYILCNNESIG